MSLTNPPQPARVVYLPISHLDTQWRWTVRETIRSFLPKTLNDHRDRFAKFPNYCVNFDGAFRYALIEEYDPEGFEELQSWVASGRWKISGAFWDAADVNVPSPESLVRQCLYGHLYFREKFGQEPSDIFLPDCFGFGVQLAIVAAHCGLVGFTSSKLRRGDWMRSSVGIPFPVGVWVGPDGSELVAALDPGGYGEPLKRVPSNDPEILTQIEEQRQISGLSLAVRYTGIGDKGGAPPVESLALLEKAVAENHTVKTETAGSSELFRELYSLRSKLPRHHGDILLSVHGTGCYTAHAAMKQCNHDNELLAEAAEKAATAADWLGVLAYPTERLREAWQRVLWHQFHDDLTGTSLPAAYDISWNDQAIAANQFAETLRQSIGGIASSMDTTAEGFPLLVFNPLSQPRTDLVEAVVPLPEGCRQVLVKDPHGNLCPAQVDRIDNEKPVVSFVADLPPLGFAIFDVVPTGGLRRSPSHGLGLQEEDNGYYRLRLDDRGDLAELFDHRLGQDLLGAPSRLQILNNRSTRFPAWEIRYEDLSTPPAAHVRGPAQTRIVTRGPARVVLETCRQAKGSTFVQRYQLAHGKAGDRLEVRTQIDWRTRGALLQATFPLRSESKTALYDRGVTAVEHGINHPELYEVPAQQWAAQTSTKEGFGTAVLSHAKYGWNKPDASTLRLTLLHTPKVGRRFRHQGLLDIGRHEIQWGILGFSGAPRVKASWAASRMNQPPLPFVVPASPGRLGRSWSFLKTSGDQALVRSVKRSEESDEVVLRLHELASQPGQTQIQVASGIQSSRTLNGVEQPVEGSSARLSEAKLNVTLAAHQPISFGLQLVPNPEKPPTLIEQRPVPLDYDWTVVSAQGEANHQGIASDTRGTCFPAEIWPQELLFHGVRFQLGSPGVHNQQALKCRGQKLETPSLEGSSQLLLLLASTSGRKQVRFESGDIEQWIEVGSSTDPIYAWDRVSQWRARLFGQLKVTPGFHHSETLGWVASHTHDRKGRDCPYHLGYLFVARLQLETNTVLLPDDPEVLLLAMSVSSATEQATPARELFGGSLPRGLPSRE